MLYNSSYTSLQFWIDVFQSHTVSQSSKPMSECDEVTFIDFVDLKQVNVFF